ncbi:hypothetical protein Bca4012_067329 [Brassica carinata]
MGKYMKKSKISGDTEATEPTSFGVRTRAAKTLALKRLNSSASDSSSYLQLRSRRLEKPPSLSEPKQSPRHHKSGIKESGSKIDSVNSNAPGSGSVPVAQRCNGDECSCGENNVEFEARQSLSPLVNWANDIGSDLHYGLARDTILEVGPLNIHISLTRESTPCNFVEDLEIIVTPGSSTRSMHTAIRDYTMDRDSMVPTSIELEEFFAYAEQQQQRLFMEKYNFDIVNNVPLTGRYEWVQVSP